jgi:C-terminal processing protease CtpA/Prc
MKRAGILCALLVLALPTRGAAQRGEQGAVAADSVRIRRLASLGKLWGYVKYFHPAIAYRENVDWDGALLDAIPRVQRATSAASYAAAVDTMLRVLNDPLTRVTAGRPAGSEGSAAPEAAFGYRWAAGRVLVITAGSYYALFDPQVQHQLAEVADSIARASAVVFDLRSPQATDAYGRVQLAGTLGDLQRRLISEPLATPGLRRRVYYGFESPTPFASGQYRTGFFVRNGTRITPVAGAGVVRSVFLVNANGDLLSAAVPLQAAGRALLVYDGDPREHTVGETATLPLGEGLTAAVRLSERVFADGTSAEFRPDVVVKSSRQAGRDEAVDRAISLAANFRPSAVRRERLPAAAVAPRDRAVPAPYPRVEERILAACRLWSAIEHFYPYKALLDHDWGGVLAEMLPTFEAARDAREYALAVAEMATRIQDSHSYVGGKVFSDEIAGTGFPPIRVRLIERVPVVTAIFDTAVSGAGVGVGDVVVRVDGEEAMTRFAATARLLSTSTPQSRDDRAALGFMSGRPGSAVRLTLRDADGRERDVTLRRRREDFTTLYHRERSGEIIRMLPDSVGYVDLDRLTYDMIDSMFARLRDARAIVFDMRGYPNGTVWAIAPRLTDSVRVAALIETPLVGHASPGPAVETALQTIDPAPRGQRYRGPTVMLMDERSVSQAEHTGLFLRAANGTRFVGSPTAGADGEITTVSLPGGMTVGFTGQGIRFPDGRQVQRIGLVPDLEVRPTLAGIRGGRDEVLEAAVKYVLELQGKR